MSPSLIEYTTDSSALLGDPGARRQLVDRPPPGDVDILVRQVEADPVARGQDHGLPAVAGQALERLVPVVLPEAQPLAQLHRARAMRDADDEDVPHACVTENATRRTARTTTKPASAR